MNTNILDNEIKDRTDLVEIMAKRGLVVDGQVGVSLTNALYELYDKKLSQGDKVCLETQQMDQVKRLGAWHTLVDEGLVDAKQAGGLVYITEESKTGPKDVVRFCTAVDTMSQLQRSNSVLCVPGGGVRGLSATLNVFSTALIEVAQDYDVQVVYTVDELAKQVTQ